MLHVMLAAPVKQPALTNSRSTKICQMDMYAYFTCHTLVLFTDHWFVLVGKSNLTLVVCNGSSFT